MKVFEVDLAKYFGLDEPVSLQVVACYTEMTYTEYGIKDTEGELSLYVTPTPEKGKTFENASAQGETILIQKTGPRTKEMYAEFNETLAKGAALFCMGSMAKRLNYV